MGRGCQVSVIIDADGNKIETKAASEKIRETDQKQFHWSSPFFNSSTTIWAIKPAGFHEMPSSTG
jgi:hypothetical protein